MPMNFVYLASASPRRRELLKQIGVPYRVIDVAVDESVIAGESAGTYVARLAAAKVNAAWQKIRNPPDMRLLNTDMPVLAADTAVVLGEKILGKPIDKQDATRMLAALSGRTHQVLTAVALQTSSGVMHRVSSSEVTFRSLSALECAIYWDTAEPRDKAGGYAIQGYAATFIKDLRGSYSGVMGLPLFETAALLDAAGVPRWQNT